MRDRYNEDVVFMEDEGSREIFFRYIEDVFMEGEGSRKKFWFAILKIIYSRKMRVREENKVFYESRRSPTSVLA